jgi:hypothetical protein
VVRLSLLFLAHFSWLLTNALAIAPGPLKWRYEKSKMISKSRIRSGKLPWGIETTQFVFLVLSLLVTLVFLIELFNPARVSDVIWNGVMAAIYWTLFDGTYKIKNWVVIPVIVFSVFSLISKIIFILSEWPETLRELLGLSVTVLLAIFFIFQLYIFTRRNTKEFFKEHGTKNDFITS